MMIEGVLPIFKPQNFTSHDVVAVMRRVLQMKRIGHTGTLDPLVTGVLPLCLGRATRLVEYLQEQPKEYEAVLTLGMATTTEDASGEVIERRHEVHCSAQQVEQVLLRFIGQMKQVPPMYSAVKVEGKRLYELARQGMEIERKARTVTIHDIELLTIDNSDALPKIKFRVVCSKGTYIRTLCVDIGKALGVPAMMSGLIRTASGSIRLEQCLTIDEVEKLQQQQRLKEHVIPLDQAVSFLPSYTIEPAVAARALDGQRIPAPTIMMSDNNKEHLIRLYSEERFLGLFQLDPQLKQIKPMKVFR